MPILFDLRVISCCGWTPHVVQLERHCKEVLLNSRYTFAKVNWPTLFLWFVICIFVVTTQEWNLLPLQMRIPVKHFFFFSSSLFPLSDLPPSFHPDILPLENSFRTWMQIVCRGGSLLYEVIRKRTNRILYLEGNYKEAEVSGWDVAKLRDLGYPFTSQLPRFLLFQ